jgi:alkanesulfonate monooxygenase SsuD/methylene tetrahydromethanopterin reductase-like flavin-dependent oxidoreductase (luciferase family)/pimeloyl-ACP methyl ester carboxylesterase
MKISAFHLMPHRELPADFEKRYESVWVTPPWWELADARRVGQYYNWTLDELLHAARHGFDGLCTNEHHQNAYGFMPNPNLMGSVLARATAGTKVAIVQMGATLPTHNPPLRVAEEYAMLDCISGGRLVAGLPLGSPMDVNLCYGITPMEHRERYREAFALTLRAWQAREVFAWNGRYFQLATVNPWPRPIQQPHPPVWVPGSGSVSTFDFAAEHDVCYCFLSYSGARSAKTMMDGYWEAVARRGRDANPYRAGFLQLVAVAETDARAEAEYARHVEYFYHKCLHVPGPWFSPPGNQDYPSLVATARNPVRRAENPKDLRYRDFVDKGYVIAGSPTTVRDRLREEVIRGLRVGNLMLLVQIGSMPHEQALKNIELLGREVLPALRGIWRDEGWVNHWWPAALRDVAGPEAAGERPGPQAAAVSRVAGARAGEREATAHVEPSLREAAPEVAGAKTVAVWRDRIQMRVLSAGRGPALVFFHGPWGLTWDPFLDALAQEFTVFAPEHPGTTPGRPDDVHHLDGLWDLVLCYDEALERLGLETAAFVGHSFGAMVACEVAAAGPRRASRLVLIDPVGFWRDDAPVTNWMLLGPRELPGHVFHDPRSEAARRMFASPEDAEAAALAQVRLTWAMGATGKFIWPLPDKGLARRIHRVTAPALVVWGKEDRLVPPVYADEFARRLPHAQVRLVEQAGHAPHLERPETVVQWVREFLLR